MTKKQEQFLWIVQTAILVNTISLTVDRASGADRSDVSMTGNWGAIANAVWASGRIPPSLAVDQAALDYCSYMLRNQRYGGEKVVACPSWLLRT